MELNIWLETVKWSIPCAEWAVLSKDPETYLYEGKAPLQRLWNNILTSSVSKTKRLGRQFLVPDSNMCLACLGNSNESKCIFRVGLLTFVSISWFNCKESSTAGNDEITSTVLRPKSYYITEKNDPHAVFWQL